MWAVYTILAAVVALFSLTLVFALVQCSRTKLTAALRRRRRESWLRRFDAYYREYLLAALLAALAAIFLLVVCFAAALPARATLTTGWRMLLACGVLVVILGTALPTAWARHAGEALLARCVPVLEVWRGLLQPVLGVVYALDEVVRRLAGAPHEDSDEAQQIEREILDAVSEAQTSGAVDESERQMIKSVMFLSDKTVAQVMTPRTDIVAIEVSADPDETRAVVSASGHSRIPVYEGTLDHIVGVLYAKDLLRAPATGPFQLRDLMRNVPFVPETKTLTALLREFQTGRVHIAVVLDEYGGTAGLVTIEDILEEVVGDIADEHEKSGPPPIRMIDEKTAELDARVRVQDVNDALGVNLATDGDYDTIGGLVLARLGRIPSVGETLVEDGVRIDVTAARDRCIARVKVHVLGVSAAE